MPSFFTCRVIPAAAVRLAATLAAVTPLLFAPVASSGGQSTSVAAAAADPRIARVDSDIRPRFVERSRKSLPVTLLERMAELGVPGLSVAVLHDGEIVWARGYGVLDLETKRLVTPETLFLAGSISKPVAAAGALRLVQEGKLGLDDDVNRWLRSWRVPPSEVMGDEVVTLRRLLTHTAGLTVHGFPGYPRTADLPTIQQILDGESPANTAPVRVDILPGSEWRYSGGGYTVMQLLLADISSRPFEELLGETVLLPLGMTSSTFENPLPEELHALAARGHRRASSPVVGDWHVYPEMAAAGLWTTATDLARFALGIQRAAAGGSSVLDRVIAASMLTPHLGSWGLGPSLSGDGATARFGHGGRDEGFDARLVAYVADGKGAALLTNVNDNDGFLDEVIEAIARAYDWRDFPVTEQKLYVELPAADLAQFAGAFEVERSPDADRDPGDEVTKYQIFVFDDRLWISPRLGRRLELLAQEQHDSFWVRASEGHVTFERDGDGAVTALRFDVFGNEGRAVRLAQ